MLPVFMILSPCFLKLHTYHVYRDLFAVHKTFYSNVLCTISVASVCKLLMVCTTIILKILC